MPTFVRLEYLTPDGWHQGHAGVNLIDPGAYVTRLAKRQKYGRAVELGEDLKPTGKVWEPDSLPSDLTLLTRMDEGSPIPALVVSTCEWCGESHDGDFDGSCLI